MDRIATVEKALDRAGFLLHCANQADTMAADGRIAYRSVAYRLRRRAGILVRAADRAMVPVRSGGKISGYPG